MTLFNIQITQGQAKYANYNLWTIAPSLSCQVNWQACLPWWKNVQVGLYPCEEEKANRVSVLLPLIIRGVCVCVKVVNRERFISFSHSHKFYLFIRVRHFEIIWQMNYVYSVSENQYKGRLFTCEEEKELDLSFAFSSLICPYFPSMIPSRTSVMRGSAANCVPNKPVLKKKLFGPHHVIGFWKVSHP